MEDLLKILNNFNFNSIDGDVFFKELNKIDKNYDTYFNKGWRERLVITFVICFFNDKSYKEIIKYHFLETNLIRDLKGFVLSIILLFEKDEAIELLNLFINKNKLNSQLNWIYAGLSIINNDNNNKYINEILKIKEAIIIIKKHSPNW